VPTSINVSPSGSNGCRGPREAEFADLLAQHYRQFLRAGEPDALAPIPPGGQAVRAKVVHYLALAGDQAVAKHAAGKAERYFSDALELVAEDALAEGVPERVTLYSKRGDATGCSWTATAPGRTTARPCACGRHSAAIW